MGNNRPKWAFLADEIFRLERPKQAKETHEEIAMWNPFTQDWRPKLRAKHVPERVQKALELAGKHGVVLEAAKPDIRRKRGCLYGCTVKRVVRRRECTRRMKQNA